MRKLVKVGKDDHHVYGGKTKWCFQLEKAPERKCGSRPKADTQVVKAIEISKASVMAKNFKGLQQVWVETMLKL